MGMITPEKKTILFLAANPSDTDRLGLGAEISEIQTELAQSTHRDCFAFEPILATTPNAMQRAILKARPQIVHFSGHGSGEDGLLLEDDSGQSQFVTAQSLSDLFELFADCVECVVLNACYSDIQSQAIAQHIPYTIGMTQAVGDRAAKEFSLGFYEALWEGQDIPFAFEYGRRRISMQGMTGALTPVLIRRENSNKYAPAQLPLDSSSQVTDVSDSRKAVVLQPINQERPGESQAEAVAVNLEEIRHDAQDGAVELSSQLYVRSPQEERACQAIYRPGALVRIKSPHSMGKSSLTIRVLEKCKAQQHRTVAIDFNQTNARFFEELDQFVQWFCASVGKPLGVRVKTDEYWDDIFGPNDNCTDYFEQYLLTGDPLTLALENFDRLFDYPEIEVDFCGLLRGWHDKAKQDASWEQLRLMIVYSQESYEPKDINQSPFNVGFLVELGAWTPSEIEALAARHGLNLSASELDDLWDLTGGHPKMVRLALAPLALGELSWATIKATAATEAGIFRTHLLERLIYLEDRPELKATMKQIVDATGPVRVKSQDAFKLDSMGLISRHNNDVLPLCEVYRAYFRERLAE